MTKTRTDRKPPLPRSPIHVRSGRVLRPSIFINTAQSQQGSLMKTIPMELQILPDDKIWCGIREMAKISENGENGVNLFKRGRFYDEYAVRRNERLKMKQISEVNEEKIEVVDKEVDLGFEKKRDLKKFNDSKSLISRTPLIERKENINQNSNSRYMLRSMTKEMKKPASSLPPLGSTSSVGGERKTVGRRGRKI
ncbi:uncharacterized protein LOC124928224 [Impatiens glandulifera]|uniref:uncharacterized protein LOC124928224 n=1 Tax=Impatiens glandulifera TaxID=253017 RepID=UPI001FB10AC3|nr:uncharacterized protein LOC124928224 [Impatiens glandulifera]